MNYKKILKQKKYRITLMILLFYIFLLFYGQKLERDIMFPAQYYNIQDFVGHVEYDLEFEDINLKTNDGDVVNGLFVRDEKGEVRDEGALNRNLIFYFHGNGGPLSYFYNDIKYIHSLGYDVAAIEYPGYGKSGGKPTKDQLLDHSRVFFNHILENKGYKKENVIFWGYSVGTAVSTEFAKEFKPKKIILMSSLYSTYEKARDVFGFTLQKILFMKNNYDVRGIIAKLNIPTLLIHGNNDKILKVDNSRMMFNELDRDDKDLFYIELEGAGHNYVIRDFGDSLKYIFKDFLKSGKLKVNNGILGLNEIEEMIKKETDKKKLKFLKNKLKKKKEAIERAKKLFLTKQKIKKIIAQNKKREAKEKYKKYINSIDIYNDNSLQKFVSAKVSFEKKSYIPSSLELIKSKVVWDVKGNQKLREEANTALQELAHAFYNKFKKELKVVSSYRTYAYQAGIKARGCPDNLCAKAGYSEHQSGLAVDFFETTTNEEFLSKNDLKMYFEWLQKNAWKYGWHNTYQKGLEIDTYEIEPWHWRYVGIELAKYLKINNITFAEFYDSLVNKG